MAQISLRIEDEVKKMAEQACADIGMSLSTAINIYLKKLGRERRIPFVGYLRASVLISARINPITKK